VIKAKLVNLKKKYFFTPKEILELKNQKLGGFLATLKRKFQDLGIEKLLEVNNLYFEDKNLVIEKTLNNIYYILQKKALSFAKKVSPNNYYLLKYFYYYLILDDLRLIIYASKSELSEKELKELSAHLISDKMMNYLTKKELNKLLKEINFKFKENKDEIELLNDLTTYLLKKLKKYGANLKTIELIIEHYNYSLKQKEKLLKINLKNFYLGNKYIKEKDFYKKIEKVFAYNDGIDSALAFAILTNKKKTELIKILYELKN
jgi:hypothetical protein